MDRSRSADRRAGGRSSHPEMNVSAKPPLAAISLALVVTVEQVSGKIDDLSTRFTSVEDKVGTLQVQRSGMDHRIAVL